MLKVDFRAERRDLYSPSAREFSIVDVPTFNFLMVDGSGDPNTSRAYAEAVEALYSLSYAAKFASKVTLGRDYVVAPLEGLWRADRLQSFVDRSKDEWSWTMMIRQPDWLIPEVWEAARAKVAAKAVAAETVRWEQFTEGLAVQVMHIGSYDEEGPTIAKMHSWIAASRYRESGEHHEIYIGDPRRSAPEKLRTVLRQPIVLTLP